MKKGQGLSLNTIIIALLGLTVLVVLVYMFTTKTQSFSKKTQRDAKEMLLAMQQQYKKCHPSRDLERRFLKKFAEDKENAIANFEQAIDECSRLSEFLAGGTSTNPFKSKSTKKRCETDVSDLKGEKLRGYGLAKLSLDIAYFGLNKGSLCTYG